MSHSLNQDPLGQGILGLVVPLAEKLLGCREQHLVGKYRRGYKYVVLYEEVSVIDASKLKELCR